MKLDLPFNYDLESKIFTLVNTFVVVARDDSVTPFVCYTLGVPDTRLMNAGKTPCFHGAYCKTRSEAVVEMYKRAEKYLSL